LAQLPLLDWRPSGRRSLLADVAWLLASLDESAAAVSRVAVAVVAIVQAPAPPAEVPVDADPYAKRPTSYRQCLALGLGTEIPCPWYSCRCHLGLDVSGSGAVTTVIAPDDIDEAKDTCLYAAARRSWAPQEIADALGFSLSLEELVQRHALLKVLGPLNRTRANGCEMDVDGVPDLR
jgi:hypothetical protein